MPQAKPGLFTTRDGRNHLPTFLLVTTLFLLWGFCNGMIDVMDKHFQQELHLSLSQSAWVQFAHYLGYFLMSLPAGWLATRLGYKGGIITGLLIVAAGGFWFLPATHIARFWAFLLGVSIIASGLTILETVANPYTTVLGDPELASTRINLAQSCNGVGWIFGPVAGSLFFYSKDALGHSTGSRTLFIPYLVVAVAVLLLAGVFAFARVPDIRTPDAYSTEAAGEAGTRSIWSHPHFVLAVAAQFLYVAAQAGIFSFFINYITTEAPVIPARWEAGLTGLGAHGGVLHSWLQGWFEVARGGLILSSKGAANLTSVGFVLFLLGRFSGALLLKRFPAHRILGLYGLLNTLACLLVFLRLGWVSVGAVFMSFFFMSIMFPTIFALGIHGLGVRAKKASSFIVMAIMGGAVLPKVMGAVADATSMGRGFIVPMFCFAFVAFYGLRWPALSQSRT